MTPTAARPRALATALLLALALAALPGCAGFFGGSSDLTLASTSTPATLTPNFTTRVFTADELNNAHIYLTDIDALGTPDARAAGMTGNILHIHMFLYPKAGRTPIEYSAANATITHVVVADGAYGIYAGGGFFLPAGSPIKGKSFKGNIDGATLKPIAATSAFDDLLGWSELSGTAAASRDDDRVEEIRAFITALVTNPALAPIQDDD